MLVVTFVIAASMVMLTGPSPSHVAGAGTKAIVHAAMDAPSSCGSIVENCAPRAAQLVEPCALVSVGPCINSLKTAEARAPLDTAEDGGDWRRTDAVAASGRFEQAEPPPPKA